MWLDFCVFAFLPSKQENLLFEQIMLLWNICNAFNFSKYISASVSMILNTINIGVIKNIQSNQTEGEQTGAKKQLISPSPLLGKYLLYNEWLKNATLTLLFVFQTLEKLRYPRLQRVLLRIVLMDHGWWFQRLLTRTSSLMLAYEV